MHNGIPIKEDDDDFKSTIIYQANILAKFFMQSVDGISQTPPAPSFFFVILTFMHLKLSVKKKVVLLPVDMFLQLYKILFYAFIRKLYIFTLSENPSYISNSYKARYFN